MTHDAEQQPADQVGVTIQGGNPDGSVDIAFCPKHESGGRSLP